MMTRTRSDLMRLLLVMKIIIAQAQLFDAEQSQQHLQSLRQKGSDRGGSFGLENFLAQPFDDENFEKHVADMEEQEIRKEPRKETKKPSRNGLPTYGLESMTPLQDFDRHLNRKSEPEDHRKSNHREYGDTTVPPFRPMNSRSEIVTERQTVRFDEGDFPSYRQSPSKNKIRNKHYNEDEGEKFNEYDGNLRKPLERPNMFRKNLAGEEVNDPEATGRPKKRITMRRRRKRPQGLATSEDSVTTAHEPTQETIAEPISRMSSTSDYKTTTDAPLDIETEQTVSKRKRPVGFRRINKPNQAEHNTKDNIVPEESNERPIIDQKENDEEIEVRTTTVAPTKNSGVKAYKPKIDRTEPFLASTETLSVNRLREETPNQEEDKSANRLKSFLKQHSTGSVSLSELLQTQNLSLADFLKGKKAEAEKAAAEAQEKNRLKSRLDTAAAASISVKSRPFSKNDNSVRNRHYKNAVKDVEEDENHEEEDDNEEKPTYNGFSPKNPRRKGFKGAEGLEPENKIKPVPTPSVVESVSEQDTERISFFSPTIETRITSTEPKTETKRLRDHQSLVSGLHQQNYRRKLKIPSKTTESTTTAEVTTPSTSASTTSTTTTTASTSAESTTTEGHRRKKLPGIKIPFKSTNNPELSLIIPNKRTRNYFNNRIQTTRITPNEKEELETIPEIKPDEEKQNEEVNVLQGSTKQEKSPVFKLNESLFNFDKSQETETHQDQKPKKTEPYNPPQVRPQDSEPRQNDEILELLKSAATAQRLEKILAARNMTIGELLLNREKGSAQANFSNLFSENKTSHYPVPTDIALEDSLFSATSIEVKTEEVKKPSKKEKPFIDELETGETSINNRVVINPEEEYEKRESRKINKNVMKFNNFGEGMEYAHGFVRNKKTNEENVFLNNEKAPNDGVYFFVPTTRDTIPPTQIYTNSKDDLYRESKFNRNEYYENENNFLEEIQRNNAANTLRRKNIASELPEGKQTETKDSEIDKSFIPPVVKSTIIISGVVMGIALFVFIAIFAACGWKQRQLRLKASSSILNDTLTKADLKKKMKNSTALTPISIKHSSTYKKTLDFDTLSVSSEASSYLWNTLKNTFTSRNNTLKNRLEKEQQGMKSRTNTINKKENNSQRTINAKEEAKKYEERLNSLHRENEKPSSSKKIYADREFIKTSNSFRRGTNVNNSHYRFDNWSHGQ